MIAFFERIETPEAAVKVIKIAVILLCVLGLIEIAMGLFITRLLIVQGVYCLAYAGLIYRFKHPSVTVFCFLWSLMGVAVMLTRPYVILALLVSLVLFRTLKAVSQLKKFTTEPEQ